MFPPATTTMSGYLNFTYIHYFLYNPNSTAYSDDLLYNYTYDGDYYYYYLYPEDYPYEMDSASNYSLSAVIDKLREEGATRDSLSWDIKLTFIILYCIIMILAIGGNILVIVVITRTPAMRTVTNTFLLSLAFSDLCIASLNMPFQLKFYLQNEWTLGEVFCKFSKYMQGVVIVASIFTLTGIAIDRYYAIMHPLRARNVHTIRRAIIILTLFWCLALVLLLPQIFIQRIEPRLLFQPLNPEQPIRMISECVEYFTDPVYNILYTFFFYIILYLVPVAIMSITYGIIACKLWNRSKIGETPEDGRRLREKKRIVRMLVVIVVLFTVSWFPFFTCQVFPLFIYTNNKQFRIITAILQLVGYSNSCFNPFIYCFMNEKFQRNAISTVCCKCIIQRFRSRQQSSYLGTQQTSNSLLMENKSMLDKRIHHTTFL